MRNNTFDFWSHHVMGPKILNEEQVFELLVSSYIWNNNKYSTFDEGAKSRRDTIFMLRNKLNNLYSYLERLHILSEVDKLYLSKQKKCERYKGKLKRYESNLNKNCGLAEELIKSLPEIKNTYAYKELYEVSYDKQRGILESKEAWKKNELIWTKSRIDSIKTQLDVLKRRIAEATSTYNKLKKRAEIR